MPAGVIVGWPSNLAIPDGWQEFTAPNGRYIAIDTTFGNTGGAGEHVHVVTCTHWHAHDVWMRSPTEIGMPTVSLISDPGSSLALPSLIDNHNVSGGSPGALQAVTTQFASTSQAATVEPYYYTLRLIRSLGTAPIPVGAFVFGLLSTVPSGYTLVSAPSYYLRAASTSGTTGGGATAHSHDGTYDHNVADHEHTVSGVTLAPSSAVTAVRRGTEAVVSAFGAASHTHTRIYAAAATHAGVGASFVLETSSDMPAYYSVALWQKQMALSEEPGGIAVLANTVLPEPQWVYVSAAHGRILRIGSPGTFGGSFVHTHNVMPGLGHTFAVTAASQYHYIVAGPVGGDTQAVALTGGPTAEVKSADHSHAIYYWSGTWETTVGGASSVTVAAAEWDIRRYRLALYEFKQLVIRGKASGHAASAASGAGSGRQYGKSEPALAVSVGGAAMQNYEFRAVAALGESMASAYGRGAFGEQSEAVAFGRSMARAATRRDGGPRRSTARRL